MMITTLTSGKAESDQIPIKEINIRRCRGCAKCMTDNPGDCAIKDDFTPILQKILSSDTLIIITDTENHCFTMPMRKAIERIGNILEAWTTSGHNTPKCNNDIELRDIFVSVCGSKDALFEDNTKEMLEKGPVLIHFEYECN